jgi:L-ascorbate metabolism protein UlaG (beta-lactamase superfamily)
MKRGRKLILWVAGGLCGMLAGCAGLQQNPYYDPAKPHHTPSGFRNPDPDARIGGGFLRWQWERRLSGLPRPPGEAHRDWRVMPDLALLRSPAVNPSVTWIGHASLLVRLGGLNVLTDPHFSERASPVGFAGPKRFHPPGVALEDLPEIHAVVISHSHYDHLDVDSVRQLHQRSGGTLQFLVPLGLKPWFAGLGIDNVTELDWWEHAEIRGVRFTLTPVQHWSARSLFDRNRTLWGGWAVHAPDLRFLFIGDTGYSSDFREIGRRLGPFDLAAIPIGAYEPRWFMRAQHIDPAEAVRVHQDLRARQSLGVHWGAFEMADESLDEAPRALASARRAAGIGEAEFFVLRVGETRRIQPRSYIADGSGR